MGFLTFYGILAKRLKVLDKQTKSLHISRQALFMYANGLIANRSLVYKLFMESIKNFNNLALTFWVENK